MGDADLFPVLNGLDPARELALPFDIISLLMSSLVDVGTPFQAVLLQPLAVFPPWRVSDIRFPLSLYRLTGKWHATAPDRASISN